MKSLLTIILLSICSIGFGQTIEQSGYTFKTKSLIGKKGFEYVLTGLIEVDGHTFQNDTCKHPFKLIVNLKGSKIVRSRETDIVYYERDCETPNCGIIHLEKNWQLLFRNNTTLTPGFSHN